jgi:hypothetical protein
MIVYGGSRKRVGGTGYGTPTAYPKKEDGMSAPTTEERRGDGWGWESLEDEAAEMRAIRFWENHGDSVELVAVVWKPFFPTKVGAVETMLAKISEIYDGSVAESVESAARQEIEADLAHQVYCLQHPESDTCR